MIKIVFKNLERSDLVESNVEGRISHVLEKFPDLGLSEMTVALSMENSPQQPGPDVFTVKWHSRGGRYRNIILKKSASNLYSALAEVVDHLLERLNRFGDRERVREIRSARKIRHQIRNREGLYEANRK